MKFDCGLTYKEKLEPTKQWHNWFAWYPIRLGDTHDCRWLEVVERKNCAMYFVSWEYRAKEYKK